MLYSTKRTLWILNKITSSTVHTFYGSWNISILLFLRIIMRIGQSHLYAIKAILKILPKYNLLNWKKNNEPLIRKWNANNNNKRNDDHPSPQVTLWKTICFKTVTEHLYSHWTTGNFKDQYQILTHKIEFTYVTKKFDGSAISLILLYTFFLFIF